MVFSSLVFVFFFLPLAIGVNFVLPARARNAWLLAASLVFYAWGEGWYVLVMLACIGFNWSFGIVIERARDPGARRLLLALAVGGNLALLLFYKYANFALASLGALVHALGRPTPGFADSHIHLPIGISFFTFQAISYCVDVARGDVKAQPRLVGYAMYKAFFPQLIAGPIVRYRDVAHEVYERRLNPADFADGVQRFIIGLAKKVLLANVLAEPADLIFGLPPAELSFGLSWFGVVCYALQIYFDFSGYSDMAIGMGRMFGFHFLENFNFPYGAQSVRDFWRRWHISLSTWFRDYLYIPLGGSRRGRFRSGANLFVVFVLCGLWHGANWTFLVWGLVHGCFLAAEHWGLGRGIERLWRPLRHAYTLGVVLVGWVPFRADSLSAAMRYLAAMAGAGARENPNAWPDAWNAEIGAALLIGVVLAVGAGPALRRRIAGLGETPAGALLTETARVAGLVGLFYLSAAALTATSFNPFIYFRF